MKKENKKQYEAPQLTVVEFKTEQGFAASGVTATRSSYGNDDGSGIDDNNNQSWF